MVFDIKILSNFNPKNSKISQIYTRRKNISK
jgi:hypothetical protein